MERKKKVFKIWEKSGFQVKIGEILQLSKKTDLEVISLMNCHLNDNMVENIIQNLGDNSKLKELNLRHNEVSERGLEKILKFAKKNPNLQKLNLSNNMIGDKGAKILSDFLVENNSLNSLLLERNQFTSFGKTVILNSLRKNFGLRSFGLDIRSEKEEINAFGKAMEENQTISGLQLPFCKTLHFDMISEILGRRKSLRSLHLNFNCKENAPLISRLLKENDNLASLDLFGSLIEDEGAIEIADALKKNTGLKKLDLGDNNILEKGGEALCNALDTNNTLLDLNFGVSKSTGEYYLLYDFEIETLNELSETLSNNIKTKLARNRNLAKKQSQLTTNLPELQNRSFSTFAKRGRKMFRLFF